ncbi:TlpA family protein disulfide reductase [Lignipirellula cremea]|uniref:TlpA family protein disulfide reductase n=1 Tax=Lignipirellula cremea TaxID=2528010 RepID=UPI0018D2568F|nr:redoxin domain-containing protein [Lignipirellula cremea]
MTRMTAAYQQAREYSDDAQVQVKYQTPSGPQASLGPLSVQFERPHKIWMEAYTAEVVSDGDKLRARLLDPATKNLDGQVATTNAPQEFHWPRLDLDPLVHETIVAGAARYPVQLELLLADKPLPEVFNPAARKQRLDDETIEQHKCYQIAVEVQKTEADPAGEFRFWIDQDTLVLRRMQFPAARMLPDLVATEGVKQVEMVIDFHAARFQVAREFVMPQEQIVHEVKSLMLPPATVSRQLGKRVDDFAFTTLDDGELRAADLQGGLTVLMWFNQHPVSRENLLRLMAARDKLPAGSEVKFFAVCAEPSTSGHEQIALWAEKAGIDLPIVRDLGGPQREPAGAKDFAIEQLPALVVLDRRHKIQLLHQGDAPTLEETLPAVIDKLTAGFDLATLERNASDKRAEAYQEHLENGPEEPLTQLVAAPELQVGVRTQPSEVQLTAVWENRTLEAPRAVCATTPAQGAASLLVLDGVRSVVEIDASGVIIERRELPLPENAAVDSLRVFSTPQGKRYLVVFQALGNQAYLFDEEQLLFAYPNEEQPHEGITDALLADLNDDGAPELYIGFWGLAGLHQVSLTGQQLAVSRKVSSVLSLETTAPNEVGWRKLLVSGLSGQIIRFNQFLNEDPAITVPDRPIQHVYAAHQNDSAGEDYLAVSFPGGDKLTVVSLTDAFEPGWAIPLPISIRLPSITAGKLLRGGSYQWIIATADGGVSILSRDAQLFDFFTYGEEVSGVTVLPARSADEHSLLIVATPTGIEAWRLDLPETP